MLKPGKVGSNNVNRFSFNTLLTFTKYILHPQDEFDVFQEEVVALVAVVSQDEMLTGVSFEPQQVSLILEGQVVMTTSSWTDSLVALFGLMYALHLSYPAKHSAFFKFLQVFL